MKLELRCHKNLIKSSYGGFQISITKMSLTLSSVQVSIFKIEDIRLFFKLQIFLLLILLFLSIYKGTLGS